MWKLWAKFSPKLWSDGLLAQRELRLIPHLDGVWKFPCPPNKLLYTSQSTTLETNMQPFGTTNFFRLMNSLDEEHINPLRGEGAITLQAPALEISIQSLAPAIARLGVDISEFQKRASTSLRELHKNWSEFIQAQAREILSGDMNRLLGNLDRNFAAKNIKSSEINAIVHFVLSYYEVVHRRAINKKEVIEGVLMRGLIKKSSFYAKISVADKSNQGLLTWEPSHEVSDDIWRHFALQTCRFLKQAITEMEKFIDHPEALRSRLQLLIDKEEREQFNQGTGRRPLNMFLPVILFGLGLGGMLALNVPVQKTGLISTGLSSHNSEMQKQEATLAKSSDYAQALPANVGGANLNQSAPVNVENPSIPVSYKP